jgi:hypothetical protein
VGACSLTGCTLSGALAIPGSTLSIGTDNSQAGTLNISNGSANAHTVFGSAATTTNTIRGPATVITNGHVLECSTSGTICTLVDGGAPGGTSITVNGGSTITSPINFQNGTGNNIITFQNTSGSNVSAGITNGTITNGMLANPGTTVGGQNCVLGSSCTPTLDAIGSPLGAASFTMPATYGYTFQGTAPASTSSGTGTAAGTIFTVTGAAGGATTGSATTAGAGGALNFTAGAGGSGSGGTNASGGAGGSINLIPGAGGVKSGSGTAGAAGVVSVQGTLNISTPLGVAYGGTGGTGNTYFVTPGYLGSANTFGANLAYCSGQVFTTAVTAGHIVFSVSVADSTHNVDVGIYNASGTLIGDTGAFQSATTGTRVVAFQQGTVTIPAGKAYVCGTSVANGFSIFTMSHTVSFYDAQNTGIATTGGALSSTITPPSDTWDLSASAITIQFGLAP